MNKTQIQEKINIIEQSLQSTKATLKDWANSIGKYHQALKELSSQLATLKKQIIMKENNINKTQGGTK